MTVPHHANESWRTTSALLLAVLCLAGCQQTPVGDTPRIDRAQLAQLNTELAVQYLQNREYQVAMDKLTKALSADPSYVEAHNAMGMLRTALGQNSEAESSFKRALTLDAENSSVLNNYGQFLCRAGRHAEGQQMFLRAVGNPLYRSPEVAYSNAGVCARSAGDTNAAEAHFRAALERAPELAPALLQMAELSYELERYPQAQSYLERYNAVSTATASSLWLGVRVARATGDRNAEASYSLQLEKNFPDSAQTRLLLESSSQ
jgi:type IV pilus assembly protein PilF